MTAIQTKDAVVEPGDSFSGHLSPALKGFAVTISLSDRAALADTYSLEEIAEVLTEVDESHSVSKIEHALTMGMLLSAARKQLPSDEKFGQWVTDKLSVTLEQKTATRYRRLFEAFGALPDPVGVVKLIGMSKCYGMTPEQIAYACAKAKAGTLNKITVMTMFPAPEPAKPDPAPEPAKPDPAPEPAKPDPAPEPAKPDPAPEPAKPDPAPEPADVHLQDPGDEAKLRARQKVILARVASYGPEGVKRATLLSCGEDWATNKHIDTNMAPLFVRGLIIAVGDEHFVARSEMLGLPIDPETLGETEKEKLARVIKQHQKKLDAAFNQSVDDAVKAFIAKHYDSMLVERLKTVATYFKKPAALVEDDYKLILSCLHPDSNMGVEKRSAAFTAFKAASLTLSPAFREKTQNGLPTSLAGLMAMRKKKG